RTVTKTVVRTRVVPRIVVRTTTVTRTVVQHAPLAMPTAAALPADPASANTRHDDMLYVTLTKVQTEGQIGTGVFARTPSDGDVFVTAWFHVENRHAADWSISSYDFSIVPPNGQVGRTTYETPDPALGGTLVAGAHMDGSLTFEVPKDSH